MRIIAIICGLLRLFTFPFAMSRPPAPKKGWLAYYSGLIGTWAKRSSLPHDAEDAAQDSIEGLLRGEHAAAIDQKAYLYRAARNRLVDEIRRQSRHEVLPLHELSDDEHPLQHDPDVALRTEELTQALRAALLQRLLSFLLSATVRQYETRPIHRFLVIWAAVAAGLMTAALPVEGWTSRSVVKSCQVGRFWPVTRSTIMRIRQQAAAIARLRPNTCSNYGRATS